MTQFKFDLLKEKWEELSSTHREINGFESFGQWKDEFDDLNLEPNEGWIWKVTRRDEFRDFEPGNARWVKHWADNLDADPSWSYPTL